jgi:4-amino-4-deoxychorismate lyase
MSATGCWIDSRPASALNPALRAVHYGDGLFETLRVSGARIDYLARHLQRLQAGCQRLQLGFADWAGLEAELQQRAGEVGEGVIKLILSRGPGARGYRFTPGQGVSRIVSTHAPPAWPPAHATDGVGVRICELRLSLQPRLAGIKHLNRLEQVMARAEWGDEYEEGLMLDYNGCLIEGTMSNLFVIRDGTLLTPRLDDCGVAGVMRSVLLDIAAGLGVETRRETLLPADLQSAEEVFLCNSLIGVWPVVSVAPRYRYEVGPLTRQFQRALRLHSGDTSANWYSW